MEYAILSNIRIPRLWLAFSIGGALSITGAILQGIYHNPLVEPYTLGISGGAALAVALVIVLGLNMSLGTLVIPAAGFTGAFITIFWSIFLQ
jgi:iron complex transport system permease protein